MDPVTHTLVGVGLGNAFFREKIGPRAIPILAGASNLPDVDALVHLTGAPEAILLRRTFGHSIFTLPIFALILSLIFKRLWPDLKLKSLFGMVLLGAFVHVFFDLVNSFGVVPLWPLSDWRPELGIIFIIDLSLTGFLALPLLICLSKKMRRHLGPLSKGTMALVALYVLFCGFNRALAAKRLAGQENPGAPIDFLYVFPEPFGPHRWRGVVRQGERYQLYLIHSLGGRVEAEEAVPTRIDHPLVRQVKQRPLAKRLLWFFKAPVWRVSENEKDGTATVGLYDLRFQSLLLDRPNPFPFEFLVKRESGLIGDSK